MSKRERERYNFEHYLYILAKEASSTAWHFPHKLDYCDTCARLTNDINAKNATKNRLLQNSQSTPEDIQNIEEDIHLLEKSLQDHKTDAHKAYEYYKECIKRCQDQWENLVLLEESGDSEELGRV